MQLSSSFGVGGFKVSNCRQVLGLKASKCITVIKFGGWRPQSILLSSSLGIEGFKVCNCRQVVGLKASKCVTVVKFWG